MQARNQLLGMAMQSKVLAGVRPDGLEDAQQLQVDIDRERALAQGVSVASINAAIGTALLSAAILLLGRWPSRTPVHRPQRT